MKIPPYLLALVLVCPVAFSVPADDPRIPEPLRAWQDWVLWDGDHRACPLPFNAPGKPVCVWPSRLDVRVASAGAGFVVDVVVFHEAWMPLPGGKDLWPEFVKTDGEPVPVLVREGRPAVKLTPGNHRIEGEFRWNKTPERMDIPPEIGMVALSLDGRSVEIPVRGADGQLWLARNTPGAETDKDFLSTKLYAELEDGIPMWLRVEVELIVSGKSREETIGGVLPAGWKAVSVTSQIPVAMDDAGLVKAQVRAGKWTVLVTAFRTDNPKDFAFSSQPAAGEILVGFRDRPDFRLVEIVGSPSVDVSQISFPEKWRELPVYRWNTGAPFAFEERMRGMGQQKPGGLKIDRDWWLDDDGGAFTFRDRIRGEQSEIWRLDAADGQDLGSARGDGAGLLITRNPANAAAGVEIRSRSVNLEATGRMARAREIPAAGWRTDAESLRVSLNLPPGWRLFALFGADWVWGDWLTAWTLLDLFLLLIFSLAVFRLWGWWPTVLAFAAFGLAYHEPGAPRYVWLTLLVPLALLRVVRPGRTQQWIVAWKWINVAALVLVLVPFVAQQVQQAIYPQLEKGMGISGPVSFSGIASPESVGNEFEPKEASVKRERGGEYMDSFSLISVAKSSRRTWDKENLAYDTKAKIQTGPGVPEWSWRNVSFGWNGPVISGHEVRPILISPAVERLLTVLRVLFALGLAAVLLRSRGRSANGAVTSVPALVLAGVMGFLTAGQAAEVPDKETLAALRTRLMEPSDAFPDAASIPEVSVSIQGNRIVMDTTIHAGATVAVPLPGKLPAWSPVSVLLDGKTAPALRRDDGFLWVAVPPGVHSVKVEGLLPGGTDWEWTFLLKPHRVAITAPDWTYSGVSPEGVPEQQVFFSKIQKASSGQAAYDRQDFTALALADRRIELGLTWRAYTTVTRLSPPGKAISLRVPLLPGENVITQNTLVADGMIEVRLGAQEKSVSWESEIPPSDNIHLATAAADTWVERWHLVVSPVWNIGITGLAPFFEVGSYPGLVPVWSPWPGESADLAVSRPEAIPGATVTVGSAAHDITLGKRQRTSILDLKLRSSLGEDFLIGLPSGAEVTALTLNATAIPVRKDGDRVVVPLRPGEQKVNLAWKSNVPLHPVTRVDEIRLPVDAANIRTVLQVPDNRWILWAHGPRRGPAVRFWTVLACSLVAAWVLGGLKQSPLGRSGWMLLGIGLTQVPLPAALLVVGWLFFIVWRGQDSFLRLPAWGFNLLQLVLIGVTLGAVGVLISAVAEGLLGNPEMFIQGNNSTRRELIWYLARCGDALPRPGCVTISIWWFRLLMLLWALWLAASLLRWLQNGWTQFSRGGCLKRAPKKTPTPPPIPKAAGN